jgi:hypothetical protein
MKRTLAALTVEGKVTEKSGTTASYSLNFVEPQYIAAKLEAEIAKGLAEQTQITPTSVTCGAPGIHAVPAERVLMCEATAPDGTKAKVKLSFDAAGQASGWELVGT